MELILTTRFVKYATYEAIKTVNGVYWEKALATTCEAVS
jgi:hypothetical protein